MISVHKCKVQCHTMDAETAKKIGMEDSGKWMPFIFDMAVVRMAKLTSDEEDASTFGCTTIFTESGDTYIIDTNYEEFFKKFSEYNDMVILFKKDDDDEPSSSDDNDLKL